MFDLEYRFYDRKKLESNINKISKNIEIPLFNNGDVLFETDNFQIVSGYKDNMECFENQRLYIVGKNDFAKEIIGRVNFYFHNARPMDTINGGPAVRLLYTQRALDSFMKVYGLPIVCGLDSEDSQFKTSDEIKKRVAEIIGEQTMGNFIPSGSGRAENPSIYEIEAIYQKLSKTLGDIPPIDLLELEEILYSGDDPRKESGVLIELVDEYRMQMAQFSESQAV